ncbi:UDP binding domain-containing protein [Wohlfahrtiimonas sp. G9077]|uniref:UDP binding domain-containing protein n=1 Tax=Wohlfahrtiimonas sp. G9077 TaxID=1980118 RepID=UPI000B9881E2|nr:UDP binding domain-containing protein [Wohlfahrtiimonas sp. G9077]OYQ72703.1 UDP-glucose 6-dehydrogenase [Wohlfahrtiimonas sp. G9077]
MHITMIGQTLQANVLAELWRNVGNCVHHEPSLKGIDIERLPAQMDILCLCVPSHELERAADFLRSFVAHAPPKLMINGATFGLHGTAQLAHIYDQAPWCYLPDIIQEGNAIDSFVDAKQMIVGCDDEHGKMFMQELLRPFFPRPQQILWMPILDAELTKLSISGMLATRISYMNDLANIAEKLGVDILNVQQGMAADTRIGGSYLSAGVGFGGANFSHDITMLASEFAENGGKSRLLQQVWEINEDQKEILFRKLWHHFDTHLQGKVIAIWGAAFKENTSSIQHSPIHKMLSALWAQGAIVQLHDPKALPKIAAQYGERADLILCDDLYAATMGADALCVLTPWPAYFSPDYARLKTVMRHPLLLDGRNIYDAQYVVAQGLLYEGVGRPCKR